MVVQGIRASDAEDLRWLRTGWLRRLNGRTSVYSVVTAGLILLFAVLGALELFEDDLTMFEVGLSIGILVVCLGVSSALLIFGIEFPRWLGITMVIAHGLVSVYYLGFSDERQNAIAALQELPIMAMYFSWFYAARIARPVEWMIIVAVIMAAIVGPFTSVSGLIGPANLIGMALFTLLSLEAGVYVRHRVRLEAETDELTGVLNRRGFIAKAQLEFRRAARHDRPVSLAVLDLDDFKSINDGSGHAAGDDVLRLLTSQWMSLSRPTDIVGRLGGDEFVMLLPETREEEAAEVMRRLRGYATQPWSWGVSQMAPDDTVDEVLRRADAAMYEDKRG